ncbi:MAG: hypothetical protein AAGG44_10755 [Planctomycetota bacterium]
MSSSAAETVSKPSLDSAICRYWAKLGCIAEEVLRVDRLMPKFEYKTLEGEIRMVRLQHSMRVFDGTDASNDDLRLAEIVRSELVKSIPQFRHIKIDANIESGVYALQSQVCRMTAQLVEELTHGSSGVESLDLEICIVEDRGVLEVEIATNQELPNHFSASRFWGRRTGQLSSVSYGCVPCPQGGTTWVARGVSAGAATQGRGQSRLEAGVSAPNWDSSQNKTAGRRAA